MLSAYERYLIAFYLANIAGRLRPQDREAFALVDWIRERNDRSAYDRRKDLFSRLARMDIDLWESDSKRQLRNLRQALRNECAALKGTKLDPTAQRLRLLGKATDLEPIDVDILEVLLRYQTQSVIESMIDHIFSRAVRRAEPLNVRGAAIPALIGASPGAVHHRRGQGAPLVSSGLVVIDSDGVMTPVDRLQRLAMVSGKAGLDVNRLLLDAAPGSELEWADFDHIAEGRDHIERLIRGALQTGTPGVNVLLYGAPGTGKSEFCKVLAERLGATLYSVGEADDDGDEPSRRTRLQELRLAQRLLRWNRGSLLLFDEMEDLLSDSPAGEFLFFGHSFSSGARFGGSKVYIHRLLERAPAPTLWTMNDARSVNQALLRRMMFALELRPPTAAVRARIWTRQLEHHGIEAGPDEAHALAREFAATPGVAAGATAAARIGGGGIETVRRGVRGLSRVLCCEAPPQGTPPLFDPPLIHADF
ncbi:MAG: AAA family ATPase, partial [Rhodospirillales bacterium]|nr:AAA family ATPase [Rhodospirillales bacterium]